MRRRLVLIACIAVAALIGLRAAGVFDDDDGEESNGAVLFNDNGSAEDPIETWSIVRGELEGYGAGLDDKPEIIALTKADLLDDKRRTKLAKAIEKESGARVFPVSAPLEEGLEPLLDAIIERLGSAAEEAGEAEPAGEGSWSPL